MVFMGKNNFAHLIKLFEIVFKPNPTMKDNIEVDEWATQWESKLELQHISLSRPVHGVLKIELILFPGK